MLGAFYVLWMVLIYGETGISVPSYSELSEGISELLTNVWSIATNWGTGQQVDWSAMAVEPLPLVLSLVVTLIIWGIVIRWVIGMFRWLGNGR